GRSPAGPIPHSAGFGRHQTLRVVIRRRPVRGSRTGKAASAVFLDILLLDQCGQYVRYPHFTNTTTGCALFGRGVVFPSGFRATRTAHGVCYR
ncbi:hypothetical protein LSTR_LSTR016598, partial [Laodelphax striatellus]